MFCLPFAGGNKYSFGEYERFAPEFVEVIPVELPGRGSRADEALLTNIYDLAEDVFFSIKNKLDKPYILYGHSMGGLLAYLTAKLIIKNFSSEPLHMFITGCTAPSTRDKSYLHLLSKEDFIKKLKELGGCPEEILNNGDILDFFEPIIKADFQAVESFEYQQTTPFDIPLTLMFGMSEKVTQSEMREWQKETTRSIDIIQMPGDHFFINQFGFQIIKVIARKISNQLQKL
ncbi:thioesterase [Fulvivirga imtechensis AK7]|uniref:Thioesterase n=2 Tax=Fulvivirga TaxID=396811 RepID=L8JR57_9BACT|nr:thioesterase [Fulvivirga imtechensis AK7]